MVVNRESVLKLHTIEKYITLIAHYILARKLHPSRG